MKPSSQENANCNFQWLPLTSRPMKIKIAPTIISMRGALRQRARSNGGASGREPELIKSFFQTGTQFLRHILERAQLRHLEGPQIRDNCPAVLDRYIGAVRAHQVAAIR